MKIIRIHCAEQMDILAELVAASGQEIAILSPKAVGATHGLGWWAKLGQRAPDLPQIVDCGPHAGLALAALKAGFRHIWVDSPCPGLENLQKKAEQFKASIQFAGLVQLDLLGQNREGSRIKFHQAGFGL